MPLGAQIAPFQSHSEVGAGYHSVALMPLAVLVESVEPRVRVGLEVRQLDSHPSCSCVALDKLLSLSGKQFPYPPNGGVAVLILQGLLGLNKMMNQ